MVYVQAYRSPPSTIRGLILKNSISILGCGWLGMPLAKAFIGEGKKVKGSTTSPNKIQTLVENGIDPYLIDLQAEVSTQLLAQFLNSNCLIIAIPPQAKHNNNLKKQILRLFPSIESSPIQHVLFISSTSVYPSMNNVMTEEFKGIPESNSGKLLLEVEDLLQSNVSFQTTVLRMAGLYGHDRKPGRFLAGKKALANGQAKVNLIHQVDCIEIISAIIEKQVWGEVLNCCSDNHPTRREFYTKAALTLGLEAPEFLSEEKSSFKIISNEKLKRTLNYKFKYPDPMVLV